MQVNINKWKCLVVPQNLQEEDQFEGRFLWLSWKAKCEVQVCEVRSVPILSIVGLPCLSIPELNVTYTFEEQSVSRHLLVDVLGQKHMPILIVVIHVFVRVLDLVGVVWHLNVNDYKIKRFHSLKIASWIL